MCRKTKKEKERKKCPILFRCTVELEGEVDNWRGRLLFLRRQKHAGGSGVIRYDSSAPAHSDLCPFVFCFVGAADRGEMNAEPRAFPVQVESDAALFK